MGNYYYDYNGEKVVDNNEEISWLCEKYGVNGITAFQNVENEDYKKMEEKDMKKDMKKEQIYLADDQVMMLTPQEYTDVLKSIDADTKWVKAFFKEVEVKGLDNAPILLAETKNDMDLSGTDETIMDCMEATGTVLSFVLDNKTVSYPVSTIGYSSLTQRAGLFGPALSYEEGQKRNPMSPESRANVLNRGLETFKDTESNYGYILCRYNRIDSFHSAEYSVLPVSELCSQVEDSFDLRYKNWNFVDGSTSPSFTHLKWEIKDKEIVDKVKSTLKVTAEYGVGVIMLTSDTSNSSAKLYLALTTKSGLPILIGSPKSLVHKGQTEPIQFFDMACALMASLEENLSLLKDLSKKKCMHVADTIRLLSHKFRLPKKFALVVAEDYGNSYTNGATFYEVFIALQDIIYQYQSDTKKPTPESVFTLSEAVITMLFMNNLLEYDRTFEWSSND